MYNCYKMELCLICLRTDRKFVAVKRVLSEYHDELCDYSMESLRARYCTECEHMLKKMYNFRNKCIMAIKIYQKWKKNKSADKKPIGTLYTLLPPITLSYWMSSDSSKTYNFYEGDLELVGNENKVGEIELPTKIIKIEQSPEIVLADLHDIITLKTENFTNTATEHVVKEKNIKNHQHPKGLTMKLQDDSDVETDDLDCSLNDDENYEIDDFLTDVSDIDDSDTVKTKPKVNDKGKRKSYVNDKGKSKKKVSDKGKRKENVIDKGKRKSNVNDKDKSKEKLLEENKSIENVSDTDTIKENPSDKDKSKENISVKGKSKQNRKRKRSPSISDDDELLKDVKLKLTKNKKQSLKDKKEMGQKNDVTDSESEIEMEDGDAKEKDKKIDGDLISILQNIDDELGALYKNWEKTALTDLSRLSIPDAAVSNAPKSLSKREIHEDIKNYTKTVKCKGVLPKLKYVSTELDKIRENCTSIIEQRDGVFNIERLKAMVKAKLESCGEMKAPCGGVIDKPFIISCLDRKISEFVLKRLWCYLTGSSKSKKRTMILLMTLQTKLRNDSQYESVFDIEYLNTEEKMREAFENRKMSLSYLDAEYKCEICYRLFPYQKLLDGHMKTLHSSGDIICPICGIRYGHRRSIIKHMDTHEIVCRCKLCPMTTIYRDSMINHYHQHKGVKYKCEPCDATFRSYSAYKTHMGYRHSGKYLCTICGHKLSSEKTLELHKATTHRDEPPNVLPDGQYGCPLCDLTFPTEKTYYRHARMIHRYKRSLNEKKTPRSPSESGQKRKCISCRVCNTVGSSHGWLVAHFTKEHPSEDMDLIYQDKRKHLCDFCGKGFANFYCLRDHLNTHTGARPYKCRLCPRRFHGTVALSQHRLLHQPPSKACQYCGKKFRSAANLYSHMRTHIGDRRFKCTICGKGFLHQSSVNAHVRGVHYNVRRVKKKPES